MVQQVRNATSRPWIKIQTKEWRLTHSPRSQNLRSLCHFHVSKWQSKTKMFSCETEMFMLDSAGRQIRIQNSKVKNSCTQECFIFPDKCQFSLQRVPALFFKRTWEQSEKLSTFLGHKLTPSTINTWNMRPHTLPPRDKVWPHKLKPTLEKIGYISPWKMYLNYNLSLRSAKHISSKRIYLPKCKKCVSPHSWTK